MVGVEARDTILQEDCLFALPVQELCRETPQKASCEPGCQVRETLWLCAVLQHVVSLPNPFNLVKEIKQGTQRNSTVGAPCLSPPACMVCSLVLEGCGEERAAGLGESLRVLGDCCP